MSDKIFSKDNVVYGKVTRTKNKTFESYWLCPKGFCSEGEYVWLGEFLTKEHATKVLNEYVKNREATMGKITYVESPNSSFDALNLIPIFLFAVLIIIGLIVFGILICR